MGEQKNIITIDGMPYSGRTTLANYLSGNYGLKQLNLETVLRRLASHARARQIKLEDTGRVLKLAGDIKSDFLLMADRNKELRSEPMVEAARKLFVMPELPEVLHERFKALADVSPGLVAVGTAMGRNVFPDAPIQIFMTADRKERLRRLCQQQKKGKPDSAMTGRFEACDWEALRVARPEGWRVGPSGYGFKEAPVRQPEDLELARALQEVYVDNSSLGSSKVAALAVSLITERLPGLKPVQASKLVALVP